MNSVKKCMQEGKFTAGGWVQIVHPSVAELMAQAGFEWLALDAEHSACDMEGAQAFLQGMQGTSCVPFIRVPGNDLLWIRRSLDVGFKGIIVPMVNSAEEAERAVKSCKFPPAGERGIGYCRANRYGFEFEEYVGSFNEEVILLCQVEHKSAVDNIDDIVSVEGLDGVFIGPYDLSASMGILGQLDHPDMKAAVETVLRAARKAGIAAGLHVVSPSPDDVRSRYEEGFRFIAMSIDITILGHYSRQLLGELKSIVGKS